MSGWAENLKTFASEREPMQRRPNRHTAALRVLARRRAYLGAMAAAGLVLSGALVMLFAFAAFWAAVLPDAWALDGATLVVAALLYLPFSIVVLSFLTTGIRAYTVFSSGPPPRTPMGMAGGMAGLGLYHMGRRLRARRGILGWVTDPWGAAASKVMQHTLPPTHPLASLLEVAGIEPRKSPTRGAGWLALAVALTGVAIVLAAQQLDPALGSLLIAPMIVLLPLAGVLGASVKGVLGGAWDRYLMDKMAAQAEEAFGALGTGPSTGAASFRYEPRP